MNRNRLNLYLDLLGFAAMVGLAATGILLYFVLPPGTGHSLTLFGHVRHDLGEVHSWLALLLLAVVTLHVVLHWDWVCCVVAGLLGRTPPQRKVRRLWGTALTLASVACLACALPLARAWVVPVPGQAGHAEGAHRHRERGLTLAATTVDGTTPATTRAAPEPLPQPIEQDSRRGHRHQPGVSHEHHAFCPEAAVVSGRTSLGDAARAAGMTSDQMCRLLGVPSAVDPRERLGRLRRSYGFSIDEVRRCICRRSDVRTGG
ncbi:MAG: DUF4405 domain-containing protein [Deltaproteobacteria bacterium]|nr:DUF4405 domain-containing protein [Deltaproteobacteria bacterium]